MMKMKHISYIVKFNCILLLLRRIFGCIHSYTAKRISAFVCNSVKCYRGRCAHAHSVNLYGRAGWVVPKYHLIVDQHYKQAG